jgi:hypothetical protein
MARFQLKDTERSILLYFSVRSDDLIFFFVTFEILISYIHQTNTERLLIFILLFINCYIFNIMFALNNEVSNTVKLKFRESSFQPNCHLKRYPLVKKIYGKIRKTSSYSI